MATSQLAGELARRHEVCVVTTWQAGLKRREILDGVNIHRVRVIGRGSLPTASLASLVTFVPAAFLSGWRLCWKVRFDLINAQFVLPSGLPAAALASLFKVPFVLSFIGGDLYDPTKGTSPHRHWWLRWMIRLISRRARVCTAISQDTKRKAEQLHGVKKRVVVMPLGLPVTQTANRPREALGLPAGILFVSVGRLIPRKGYEVLLQAWRGLPQAHLAIIGGGPLRERLASLAGQYGLKNRVCWLGTLSEVRKRQVLRAADAFISASQHEGFGLVFLEAMDAGLPIVAANCGGQLDFLRDGKNAILVPPGRPDKFRRAVMRLQTDKLLRKRMGRLNAREVRRFYLSKTAAAFEKVLKEAAGWHENSY